MVSTTAKLGFKLLLLCLLLTASCSVQAFIITSPSRIIIAAVATDRNYETRFLASKSDNDDMPNFLPKTSFGADAVPEGQRPVNEYLDLLRAPLFGWASEETGTNGLLLRLGVVYLVTFAAVCYPISGATFTQDGFELQKMAASNIGALFLTILLVIRLYSGWGYVGSRLNSKVIEYEETGWYDGDFEEKSETERKRDQFLYKSNVKPVEDRLKMVSLVVSGLFVASCFAFNATMRVRPVFDEYDPKMLERMRYDGTFHTQSKL